MQDDNSANWKFNPQEDVSGNTAPQEVDQKTAPVEVSWTASEFIDHQKNTGWYLLLLIGVLLLAGIVYLATRDLVSAIVIIVVGILFAVLAGRKPRQLSYRIDSRGIQIGEKSFEFSTFKSFTIHQEGVIGYITLLPLKRFMPDISIFFPPEDAEKITEALSYNLPNEQHKEHGIDRLMKKLRF